MKLHARTTRRPAWRGLAILLLLVASAAVTMMRPDNRDRTATFVGATLRVIDGDTVAAGVEHYRLVGFDTPERALAARATARLQAIIAADATLQPVACACAPGTEGTRRCNYGRRCGRLTVNGEDAGAILIREGLAHRYICSHGHCPRRGGWC